MNILGIFVKQPLPGRVKTRLAADVGAERAAELYAAFVDDVVERFRAAADCRLLCHSPNDQAARDCFRGLSGNDYELWPQPEGSLGHRLECFFADAFGRGGERVVAIGSDSPTLPARLVEDAFELLARHDCVLGPATDGGYYLIGQNGVSRPLFDGIAWSRPSVLQQTAARVEAADASLALLPPWYDIDTADDLELLRGHLCAMQRAGDAAGAPRTARALARPGSAVG